MNPQQKKIAEIISTISDKIERKWVANKIADIFEEEDICTCGCSRRNFNKSQFLKTAGVKQ